jgi:hypothetical protein
MWKINGKGSNMKTTKEMIEVMAAFERGEEIEWCQFGQWLACPNPIWDWRNLDYRIKPKPAKPKYTESDIPLCAVIRNKDLPQDVIDKACEALVRYANDDGHVCHCGTFLLLTVNAIDAAFRWHLSDEGEMFWQKINNAPDRPDPYAEAKQAFADGVLEWLNEYGEWIDCPSPGFYDFPSHYRRKPEPTGKWVEYPVTLQGLFYRFNYGVQAVGLIIGKAQSIKGYGGTRYQGREDFVFTPPVDERGVMLAPVAVRFWVANAAGQTPAAEKGNRHGN